VRTEAERLAVGANTGVTDPAARVARGLCVFLRFAIEHPDSAKALWRLNPGSTMADAPINRNLRDDLMRGIRARRFAAVDLEIGLLLVMGAVVIAMRHVLEERVATPQVPSRPRWPVGCCVRWADRGRSPAYRRQRGPLYLPVPESDALRLLPVLGAA